MMEIQCTGMTEVGRRQRIEQLYETMLGSRPSLSHTVALSVVFVLPPSYQYIMSPSYSSSSSLLLHDDIQRGAKSFCSLVSRAKRVSI